MMITKGKWGFVMKKLKELNYQYVEGFAWFIKGSFIPETSVVVNFS